MPDLNLKIRCRQIWQFLSPAPDQKSLATCRRTRFAHPNHSSTLSGRHLLESIDRAIDSVRSSFPPVGASSWVSAVRLYVFSTLVWMRLGFILSACFDLPCPPPGTTSVLIARSRTGLWLRTPSSKLELNDFPMFSKILVSNVPSIWILGFSSIGHPGLSGHVQTPDDLTVALSSRLTVSQVLGSLRGKTNLDEICHAPVLASRCDHVILVPAGIHRHPDANLSAGCFRKPSRLLLRADMAESSNAARIT